MSNIVYSFIANKKNFELHVTRCDENHTSVQYIIIHNENHSSVQYIIILLQRNNFQPGFSKENPLIELMKMGTPIVRRTSYRFQDRNLLFRRLIVNLLEACILLGFWFFILKSITRWTNLFFGKILHIGYPISVYTLVFNNSGLTN